MEKTLTFKNKKSRKTDASVQNILQRLASMVQKTFRVNVEYIFFDGLQSDEHLKEQLGQQGIISTESGDYFAIYSDKEIVGSVHVDTNLSDQDQEKLQKMIDLIVSFAVKSSRELQTLSSLEQKMNLLDPSSNVVRIDHFQQRRLQLLKEFEKPEARGFHSAIFEVLINKDKDQRFKEAFCLHEDSQRYAFLNIDALSSESFNSLSDFLSIGNATIYVEDVSQLQAPMQKFLRDYIELSDTKLMGPCIIFGSQTDLSEVQTFIEPDLFNTLLH